ncbi:MAG: MAPEG family protein [Pseudomonadota bacterium]
MDIPITLTMAALAALINIWLAVRIGRVRGSEKVSVGDGGSDIVLRRMRAQANFVENTPFVLALIAALEIAGHGSIMLWSIGYIYMAARIAHGFGMDGGALEKGRMVGTIITLLTLLLLALYAAAVALGLTPH